MRRSLVTAVFAVATVALWVPPALAQVPTPRVTITGLFDQITSAGRNFYDGYYTRDNDREWYARARFRPDFEFAVGRTKAVLGLEMDLTYGQSGSNDGGFPGNNSGATCGFAGGCKVGALASLDLNTDVGGIIEIKWIYTEFDLTGKDSLLPFIPFSTVARAGAQPFGTIANYKAYYAQGDFAGADLYSTFTPDFKIHFAWVNVEDQLAGGNRAPANIRTNRGKDYAIIVSPEITFKALDIKPMFSWFHADGVTSFAARRLVVNNRTVGLVTTFPLALGSNNPANGNSGGDATMHEERYTVGLDSRLRIGPFGLDPTISYQWGNYDTQALRTNGTVGKVRGDHSAWLVDIIGSLEIGPLLLEARAVYSTGNKARDNLSLSKRYYEPLDLDTGYWSGWLGILGLGIDYFNGGGASNQGMSTNIGYDRYGRAQFALRATYSISPDLSIYGVAAPTWSAEKVDTDTGCPPDLNVAGSVLGGCFARGPASDKANVQGDSRYIGTEVNGGVTWRFAPNTALDLAGYYLFAGPALDLAENLGGTVVKREARDAYYVAARVRFSF